MPLADVRPDGVDLLFRSGTTVTLSLEWPEDSLDGRSFTSTLNGEELAVTVDGDVMTVEASATITGDLTTGVAVEWLLLEDLGGVDPEPILIGTWTPSDLSRAVSAQTAQVTEGAATVTVSPIAGPTPPEPEPSNELDVAEATDSDITGLSTGGVLQLIAVPGLVVTVPDVGRPVWVLAQAVLDFDNAPASIGCAIAVPGSTGLGDQIAFAGGVVNVSTDLVSQMAWGRLPPSSPGDYQMFVWASVGGTIDIRIGSVSPARIAVLAV